MKFSRFQGVGLVKRYGFWVAAGLLGLYTLAMLFVEAWKGQSVARHYFSEVISGDLKFYAINTTLSMTFLWAAAVVFLLIALMLEKRNESLGRVWWFCVSQVLILGWLGLDDRFQIHESIGTITGVRDDLFLLLPAALEGVALLVLGRFFQLPTSQKWVLFAAVGLFVAMVVVDMFFPEAMRMRLSVEDLLKTWGGAMIFVFSLQYFWAALPGDRYGDENC